MLDVSGLCVLCNMLYVRDLFFFLILSAYFFVGSGSSFSFLHRWISILTISSQSLLQKIVIQLYDAVSKNNAFILYCIAYFTHFFYI